MSEEVDRRMEEYFETMPFLQTLGIEEAIIEDGTAEFHIPYDEDITNHTVVHGGVMATLVDATVAGAIHSDAEAPLEELEPLTVDMDINYLGPVQEGDIVAEASLVNRGGTIVLGESDIYNEGELVVTGTATYFQKWKTE